MTTVSEEAVNAAKEALKRTLYPVSFQGAEAALTAALPHLPGVGVKKLEWRKYRNGDAEAVTPFGEIYTAYVNGYWRITRNGKAGKFIKASGGDDVDAAKAGAQADFDANVLRLVRSQAVELLAAERAKKEMLAESLHIQIKRVNALEAENAALTARFKYLETEHDIEEGLKLVAVERAEALEVKLAKIEELLAFEIKRERDLAAKQLSEVVDRMSDDYLALKAELDQAVGVIEDRSSEYEALEAKLAAAEKALATHRSATKSVCESYRGTKWGKAAECIFDAIESAALGGKPS